MSRPAREKSCGAIMVRFKRTWVIRKFEFTVEMSVHAGRCGPMYALGTELSAVQKSSSFIIRRRKYSAIRNASARLWCLTFVKY